MCESLAISRSGYYRWIEAQASAHEQADMLIKEHIEGIFEQARGRYGYRPVHAHLQEAGVACGRDRTLRLMRELGLVEVGRTGVVGMMRGPQEA